MRASSAAARGVASACVLRRLGDAERSGGVEEAGVEVALHVAVGVAGREAAAQGGGGQRDGVERDGVAAGGAHAERVPVAVDGDAVGVGRHHRVAVALPAVLVGEA